MKGKPIKEFKDHLSIVPSSNYKDNFALDVSKWASVLYKGQTESYMYVPVMPNKPSGR